MITTSDIWWLLGLQIIFMLIAGAVGYMCGRTDGLNLGWKRWGPR